MGRTKGSKNGITTLIDLHCKECNKKIQKMPCNSQGDRFCSKSCLSRHNGKNLPLHHFKKMSDIANKNRKGKTIKQIYEGKPETIRKILNTLKMLCESKRVKVDKTKILQLYRADYNIVSIAKSLEVSPAVIRSRLIDMGLNTNPHNYYGGGTFKKGHNFHNKKEQTAKKISKKALERWKDKDWVKKWAKAKAVSPNRLEKDLMYFIKNNNLPYKYVGDFSDTINGRCPDFIDIKNKKVVEIFGRYWHSPLLNLSVDYKRTYHGTMEFYKEQGYKCLILWDYELENRWIETCTRLIDFTENMHTIPDIPLPTEYYKQKYGI